MKLSEDILRRVVNSKTGENVIFLEFIESGVNSLAVKVETDAKRKYLLKTYSSLLRDPRNRLETEFGSLQRLWKFGYRNIPKPVFADPAQNLAAYSFIDGEHLQGTKATASDIDCVVKCLWKMQKYRVRDEMKQFPDAAEACFSISTHQALVSKRLARLRETKIKDAHKWINEMLRKTWQQIVGDLEKECRAKGLTITNELAKEFRVLSPSDVGLHNILKESGSGRLVFVDFEYFGWDDPVKLMCDFILEPAVPLPEHLHSYWVKRFSETFRLTDQDLDRFTMLYPVLAFKWCLIVLNVFLPDRGDLQETISPERLKIQLSKSRQLHDRLIAALQERRYEKWPQPA